MMRMMMEWEDERMRIITNNSKETCGEKRELGGWGDSSKCVMIVFLFFRVI